MHYSKHSIKRFKELSQAFQVAYEDHYTLLLTGSLHRRYRTGFVLRKLVDNGTLLSQWWGRKKIFICKRRARNQSEYALDKVTHGLMCTEIMVRLYLSKKGELLSNADFSGQSFIPDGGVDYGNGSQILFEYSTKDNWNRKKIMADKVTSYQDHPSSTTVLFVIDTNRIKLEAFIKTHPSPIWFCDLETFLSPAYHEQLQAPIYIWGGSGDTLPIISNGR
jgi:hypothetical protein